VPVLLVGLKTDLRDDARIISSLQKIGTAPVTLLHGREVGIKIGAVAYLEASAKKRQGIHQVFEAALRASFDVDQKKRRKWLGSKCNLM
jgi:GTPase SAR1 family protein